VRFYGEQQSRPHHCNKLYRDRQWTIIVRQTIKIAKIAIDKERKAGGIFRPLFILL
jgi:hypothetical protein